MADINKATNLIKEFQTEFEVQLLYLSEASNILDQEDVDTSDLNKVIKDLKKLVSADLSSSTLNVVLDKIESENDIFELEEIDENDYFDQDDLEDDW